MKTVIEMARQCGIVNAEHFKKALEDFAALVREDERERNGIGDYMEGLEEGYAAGQRDEREKQQEPVAWIIRTEKGERTLDWDTAGWSFTKVTPLYTTPPTAALAARQMRDAAVQKLMEIGPSIGASRGVAMKFAAEIAALPIPGEEK